MENEDPVMSSSWLKNWGQRKKGYSDCWLANLRWLRIVSRKGPGVSNRHGETELGQADIRERRRDVRHGGKEQAFPQKGISSTTKGSSEINPHSPCTQPFLLYAFWTAIYMCFYYYNIRMRGVGIGDMDPRGALL